MLIAADLFRMGEPVLEKGVRTVAVYAGVLLLLRLGGKRDLAQLNSFDLVVLLLLSNVVQNAVIGADDSLAGGLLGAVVLVAVNGAIVRTVSGLSSGGRAAHARWTTTSSAYAASARRSLRSLPRTAPPGSAIATTTASTAEPWPARARRAPARRATRSGSSSTMSQVFSRQLTRASAR